MGVAEIRSYTWVQTDLVDIFKKIYCCVFFISAHWHSTMRVLNLFESWQSQQSPCSTV